MAKESKEEYDVIIYSTPTCPYCHMAKDYFKEKGIKFKDYNVAENDKARDKMIEKSNQMGVPVIDIKGTIIIGFDRPAIDNALKRLKK